MMVEAPTNKQEMRKETQEHNTTTSGGVSSFNQPNLYVRFCVCVCVCVCVVVYVKGG